MTRGELEDRFYSKVIITPIGCWDWIGSKQKSGYGILLNSANLKMRAHRLSWVLHFGPIDPGMLVCHKCDRRQCVNPDHLFLGDYAENMQDRKLKGRYKRKDSCPQGHAYSGDNLIWDAGSKRCRICRNATAVKNWRRRESKRVNPAPPS